MDSIIYVDRITQKLEKEQVYGAQALQFLYGNTLFSKIVGRPLLTLLARNPFFSRLYGWWQKNSWTKHRIAPFIQRFKIDTSEFLDSPDSFYSFNDFFIRQLKSEARPICPHRETAIIPADGRYLFYPRIDESDGFLVKGKKFLLSELLNDPALAAIYAEGSMVIARLCPTDYHRFHFPADCVPGPARLINGWLYSVNPIALKKNINIFTENKRAITQIETEAFGSILFIEIGATNVGSIIQTYQPEQTYQKGSEKGYFSFGASSLILLFPPKSIQFDADLVEATTKGLEVRCLMGQSMGRG